MSYGAINGEGMSDGESREPKLTSGYAPVPAASDTESDHVGDEETVGLINEEPKLRSASGASTGSRLEDAHLINSGQALMHLLKGNIGTGLLGLPYAFAQAGIVGGPVFMFFICAIALTCMDMLLAANHHLCKLDNRSYMDYGDLAECAFRLGPIAWLRNKSHHAKNFINAMLIFTQLGFCSIYFVFMAGTVTSVLEDFDVHDALTEYARLDVALFFVPVVLLCLIRNLDVLAVFSMMANVVIGTGVIIIFSDLFDHIPEPGRLDSFKSFSTFPLFFGSAIYSCEGIGLVLPLENKMRNPESFKYVLNVGMTFTFALFISIGFFGYNKFGDQVQSSISYSLPDEWYFSATKIMFGVAMYITYALQFFVPVKILMPWVNRRFLYGNHVVREYIFRVFLITLTFIAAIVIPFLGLFIELVGSVASTSLAILMPSIIFFFSLHTDTSRSDATKLFYRILVFVMFIIGIVGAVCGTIVALQGIIEAFSAPGFTPLVPTIAPPTETPTTLTTSYPNQTTTLLNITSTLAANIGQVVVHSANQIVLQTNSANGSAV